MTKIEQIEWAKQILGGERAILECENENVKRMTAANLKMQQALDAMTRKLDRERENANRQVGYWRKRAEGIEKAEQLLEVEKRVNAIRTKQVEVLRQQLDSAQEYSRETSKANERLDACTRAQKQELAQLRVELTMVRNKFNVADADLECSRDEVKRLKQRVNVLVRKLKG